MQKWVEPFTISACVFYFGKMSLFSPCYSITVVIVLFQELLVCSGLSILSSLYLRKKAFPNS